MVKTMFADDLVPQGASTSAAKVLTQFSQNILVLASEGSTHTKACTLGLLLPSAPPPLGLQAPPELPWLDNAANRLVVWNPPPPGMGKWLIGLTLISTHTGHKLYWYTILLTFIFQAKDQGIYNAFKMQSCFNCFLTQNHNGVINICDWWRY